MSETVSIIVPTYDNPQLLTQCLESLLTHRMAENIFKVYVVDNGKVKVKSYLPENLQSQVEIIDTGRNLGWEGGLKAGMEVIPKDVKFVMFLNDDTYLPYASASWLHDMLQWFVHPTVGAVGPTSNVVMGNQNIFMPNPVPAYTTSLLIGFCMLLRRSALEKAGGIDDTLPGGDDFDLSIRLEDSGYKMIIDRNIFLFHHGFKTGERLHGGANVGGGWNSYEMQQRVNTALIQKHGFARFQKLMLSIGSAQAITPFSKTVEDAEGNVIREIIPQDGKVYELGCGGQLTIPTAIGVDFIPQGEYISTISKHSLATITADVSKKLPFIDANIIIARHVLEHMTDPIEALNHWKDALLPEGKLIVAVPDEGLIKTIPMNKEHKHAYTKEFAIRLFSLIGFKDIHVYDSKNGVSFIITGVKL